MPNQKACLWCGRPATLEAALVIGRQVRLRGPICDAHGAAAAMGQFEVMIRCMDRKDTVGGWDRGDLEQGPWW